MKNSQAILASLNRIEGKVDAIIARILRLERNNVNWVPPYAPYNPWTLPFYSTNTSNGTETVRIKTT